MGMVIRAEPGQTATQRLCAAEMVVYYIWSCGLFSLSKDLSSTKTSTMTTFYKLCHSYWTKPPEQGFCVSSQPPFQQSDAYLEWGLRQPALHEHSSWQLLFSMGGGMLWCLPQDCLSLFYFANHWNPTACQLITHCRFYHNSLQRSTDLGRFLSFVTETRETGLKWPEFNSQQQSYPYLGWRSGCRKPNTQCGLNAVLELKYHAEKQKKYMNMFWDRGSRGKLFLISSVHIIIWTTVI